METYLIRFGMSTIPGDPTSYIILRPRNTRSGAASGLAYLPEALSALCMLSLILTGRCEANERRHNK